MEKTKVEELKQEAEEYALEKCKECYMCNSEENGERIYCAKLESRKEGYIAGAEPREKRIAELEKENAKVKEFVNAPHTKGRKTTRGDYIKTVWDLSKQLTKARELLKKWLQTSKASGCDNINILTDTEQFLRESE